MLEPKKWEVIAGRYRLTRELARGGMGSVWAGQDKKLRRNVAVKLVAPTWDGASEARQRFEREAMAVAQLQSPHVVQIYDYGVERDCPYIVMELLEGEDLRTRLHQVKRVTLETAAQILVQTAKALSVAHAVGIIHRDLKPGNIFLVRANEEELVKVLDFGVAKQVQSADLLKAERGDEAVMGTPQFMSPEQARGLANIDHRTDLWALGVIIYRALTGHLPFHAPTPTEVIVKVCTEDPRKISDLAPDLPAELDEFFARALARDPDQRFESARQMTLAFSRISPVTFTTLTMPDPDPAIEEAIRLARAAAGSDVLDDDDDDEAATVAFDGHAAKKLASEIDDAKGEGPAGDPVPRTLRGQGAPLPAPTPPPRRSHPGPPPPRRPPARAPAPPGEPVPPTVPFQRVHSAPPIPPVAPPPPGQRVHTPPPVQRVATPPPLPSASTPGVGGASAPPPVPVRGQAAAAPALAAAPPAPARPAPGSDSTPQSGVVPTPTRDEQADLETPTPAAAAIPEPTPSADALTPPIGAAIPAPPSAPIPLGGGLPSLLDEDSEDDAEPSAPTAPTRASAPATPAPFEPLPTGAEEDSEEQRLSAVPVLADTPKEGRSTLLLAIGAVVVGVLIAVVGSVVVKGANDEAVDGTPVADEQPPGQNEPAEPRPQRDEGTPGSQADELSSDPDEQSEADQGEDAVADNATDKPTDDGQTEAKAVAKAKTDPPPPAKAEPPPPKAEPPEPPPATATAAPPPPKPPPPKPPPAKTSDPGDPFADRL